MYLPAFMHAYVYLFKVNCAPVGAMSQGERMSFKLRSEMCTGVIGMFHFLILTVCVHVSNFVSFCESVIFLGCFDI